MTDDEPTPIEAIAARARMGACEVRLWQKPRVDEETGDTLIVFGFRIAAGDMPECLLYCKPGSRFMLAVVEIDGLNMPVPERDFGLNAIRLSHAMMRDPDFRRWAAGRSGNDPSGSPRQVAQWALQFLYDRCGIESRAELRTKAKRADAPEPRVARDRLYLLNGEYQRSLNKTGWGNPEPKED